jgi:hypothetical protein
VCGLLGFAGVFHVFDDIKLHVVKLTVFLLDFAQVDVVHHIAGLRIDVNLTTRALENLTLHGRQQGFTATLAALVFFKAS